MVLVMVVLMSDDGSDGGADALAQVQYSEAP